MLLGLDLSSTVVGWTILDDDGNFVDIGYLELKKYEDLYEKSSVFLKCLFVLFAKYDYKIDKVFIEEPVQVYSTSTARVIGLLQRWNGFASCLIFQQFAIKPTLISSHSARKACGIKVPRGVKTKQYLFDEIFKLKVIPECVFSYKKTGNPKDFCYDMVDSYIVAKGGYLNDKT